jgi:hypothetical protein
MTGPGMTGRPYGAVHAFRGVRLEGANGLTRCFVRQTTPTCQHESAAGGGLQRRVALTVEVLLVGISRIALYRQWGVASL